MITGSRNPGKIEFHHAGRCREQEAATRMTTGFPRRETEAEGFGGRGEEEAVPRDLPGLYADTFAVRGAGEDM
ncbi:hypothetical protein GCM10027160_10540 [Streptomyces calidiresistens]